MRRVLAILLCLSLLAVGCGDARGPEEGPDAAVPSTAVPTPTVAPEPSATATPLPTPMPTLDHVEPAVATPSLSLGVWERWAATDFLKPGGLVVDAEGQILALTRGGVVRWDPADESYDVVSDPMWESMSPWSAAVAPNGEVWFGFHESVARWNEQGGTVYALASQEDWASPIEVEIGPDGSVWAGGAPRGLFRFTGAEWSEVEPAVPGHREVEALAVDNDGQPWVGGFSDGLHRLVGGSWIQESLRPVSVVATSSDGTVWYATRELGTPERSFVTTSEPDGGSRVFPMGNVSVWAIVPHGPGAFVVTSALFDQPATASFGLWWLDVVEGGIGQPEPIGGDWDNVGAQLVAAVRHPSGDLWLGSSAHGLWRFDGETSSHFLTDTYGSHGLAFVEVGAGGEVWAGDCERSSMRIDEQWRLVAGPTEGGSESCVALIDDTGTQWLAVGDGLARLEGDDWVVSTEDADGTRFAALNPNAGEGGGPPEWFLAVTADGTVWAAMVDALDGLWRWEAGSWHRTTIGDTSGEHVSRAMAAGSSGELWVASREAVLGFDSGEWRTLPRPGGAVPSPVVSLAVGGDRVWASTYDEILGFDGQSWRRQPRPDDVRFDVLMVDESGAAWMSGPSGLVRFDGESRADVELPPPVACCVTSLRTATDGSWWIAGPDALLRWTPESN
jgi:hypothetical protein